MALREIAQSDIPPDHPVSVFYRYWAAAAAGRPAAPWTAFDATQHASILPWVLLLKRESPPDSPEDRQWRYIVCGTGCTDLFGFSYQGKLFGEGLPPEAVADRTAEFERAVAGAGPQFSHTRLPIPGRDFLPIFRGVFPFSSEDGEVDRLFVVLAQEDARA